MGPYCNYCGRRCFVPRIVPDDIMPGRELILATCPAGMAHDREVIGHDHTTAINPRRDPAELDREQLQTYYNALPRPNVYGDELLRRIHHRDRIVFGMSADNPALRD